MAFAKADLTKLTKSTVAQANTNATASSNLENARNDSFFSTINNIIDYAKSAFGWLAEGQTWTGLNVFNLLTDFLVGIQTNSIQSRTSGANITLKPQGAGKLFRDDDTVAGNEIRTKTETEADIQAIADTVSGSVAAAAASQTAAAASEAKAQDWAEEVEDTEVEVGKYSALHHAAKSEDFATTASGHATTALGHANKAQDWAEELEDVQVETGKYSALHHSAKASASATAAAASATTAEATKLRVAIVNLVDTSTDIAVADGVGSLYLTVPSELNNFYVTNVQFMNAAAGTTSSSSYQVHNVDGAVDLLSTAATIDAAELSSNTAAVPPVINQANNQVSTDDRLRFDCDSINSGTVAKGLTAIVTFSSSQIA